MEHKGGNLTVGEFTQLIHEGVCYSKQSSDIKDDVDSIMESLIETFQISNYRIGDKVKPNEKLNLFLSDANRFFNDSLFYGGIIDNTFGFMGHSVSGRDQLVRAHLVALYALKNEIVTEDAQMFKLILLDELKLSMLADIYVGLHLGVFRSTGFGVETMIVSNEYPFDKFGHCMFRESKNIQEIDYTSKQALSDLLTIANK